MRHLLPLVAAIAYVAAAAGLEALRQPLLSYERHGEAWTDGECGQRDQQSPINFFTLLKAPPTDSLHYYYEPIFRNMSLAMDGRKLTATFNGNSTGSGIIYYQGQEYTLTGLEFHAESEHTWRGEHRPLEMQLIHTRRGSARKIIISVMISCVEPPKRPDPYSLLQQDPEGGEEGGGTDPAPAKPAKPAYKPPDKKDLDFNPDLQGFLLKPLPVKPGQKRPMRGVNLNGFVDGGIYLSYVGSETTPPCAKKVTWFVRRNPVLASQKQIQTFWDSLMKKNPHGNYRHLMPQNNRVVSVWDTKMTPPGAPLPKQRLQSGPNARNDHELETEWMADNAAKQAYHAKHYLHGLKDRIQRAAAQQTATLKRKSKIPPSKPYEVTVTPSQILETAYRDVRDKLKRTVRQVVANVITNITDTNQTIQMPTVPPPILPWARPINGFAAITAAPGQPDIDKPRVGTQLPMPLVPNITWVESDISRPASIDPPPPQAR